MEGRKQRTLNQNNAAHLYFRWVAKAFQEKDIDLEHLLQAKPLPVPVTETIVKDIIFKPLLKVLEGKGSTTEMNTVDPSEVYDVMNRWLINEFNIKVPWPSEEFMMEEQR